MLARREHSGSELRAKLAAKGFPPDVINDALTELDRSGWLSDERFADVRPYVMATRNGEKVKHWEMVITVSDYRELANRSANQES